MESRGGFQEAGYAWNVIMWETTPYDYFLLDVRVDAFEYSSNL